MTSALSYLPYVLYGVPLLGLFLWANRRRQLLEAASRDTYVEARDAGLTQPPSLHPVIDPTRCIGCESCIHACPEFPAHQVLGILEGRAQLVSPTDCIGHGACQRVCPTGAISLVFGTAERGVDIPAVNADFSTNVPGVYIAGELGGMGLIRNAIEQGRQALATIAGQLAARDTAAGCDLDLLIVGAGPAGISATLAAMQAGLNHRTIEQHMLGGTVASFPRGKVVMTAPSVLPLVGEVPFKETSKEALLDFWNGVRRDTGMEVSYGERLLAVETMGSSLRVTTSAGSYQCRAVLLAIGRRGTPRKLEVPGEGQGKVKYSLLDPADHRGQQVVVVGGGDSALEAACSIAMEAGSEVTLCYRGAAFTRARKKNRERLESLMAEGRVQVLLESSVIAIGKDDVLIEHQGGKLPRPNDAVIVCAGGILPNGLLREIGVAVETKYGTR